MILLLSHSPIRDHAMGAALRKVGVGFPWSLYSE